MLVLESHLLGFHCKDYFMQDYGLLRSLHSLAMTEAGEAMTRWQYVIVRKALAFRGNLCSFLAMKG